MSQLGNEPLVILDSPSRVKLNGTVLHGGSKPLRSSSRPKSQGLRTGKSIARETVPITNRVRRMVTIFAVLGVSGLALWLSGRVIWANYDAAANQSRVAAVAPRNRFAAPGFVEPAAGTIALSFETAGTLAAVYIEEGDPVKAGQLVAHLADGTQRQQVESATAALAAAQAEYQVLKIDLDQELAAQFQEQVRLEAHRQQVVLGAREEDIAQCQSELKGAEIEWQRLQVNAKRFQDTQLISTQAYFDLQQSVEQAHQKAIVQQAILDRTTKGATKEEIHQAEAAVLAAEAVYQRTKQTQPFRLSLAAERIKQAEAAMASAQIDLKKTSILSPIDGVVLWKYRSRGEAVLPVDPQPVVVIADMSHLQVRASVDEHDFPYARANQKVEITCEAYPDQRFSGRVVRVNQSAGKKRFITGEVGERMDIQVVEAIIQLDDPSKFIIHQRVTAVFLPDSTPPIERTAGTDQK